MTKKDYILIANAVKRSLADLSYASTNMGETNRAIYQVAEQLALELGRENDKFNESKFLEACGV